MPSLIISERSVVRFMPRRARLLRLNLVALSYSFTPSGFAQSVSQFFVNLPSVAEGEYPNEPGFAIDFIDEAKPSHFVFPQAVNSRRSGSP